MKKLFKPMIICALTMHALFTPQAYGMLTNARNAAKTAVFTKNALVVEQKQLFKRPQTSFNIKAPQQGYLAALKSKVNNFWGKPLFNTQTYNTPIGGTHPPKTSGWFAYIAAFLGLSC